MTHPIRTSEQDRNIDVFRRAIEDGFNNGDLDILDALFTADFQEHQRGFPTPDLDGLKRGIASVRRAIPDIRLEIVDTIVEGDKVSFHLTGEGTHEGQLGPLPGSGKHVTWDVFDVCRFRDGQISEHWGVPDRMAILEQVGMPQPPRWLMKLMMKRAR
ncbi:MAG: ester cyclase [Actinobacteria bacterium]|nr:ester cyclase [Actinomycetota bacterium]MBU1493880.1 ester cyclase [Actinomycetota bacterium]MBU1865160.1 ester cyclase [Actinomycetota bacterium]